MSPAASGSLGRIRERVISTSRGPLSALEAHPPGEALGRIVMVTGYLHDKDLWTVPLALLSRAGYRCLVYNHLGQPGSGRVSESGAYEVQKLAGDLSDVLTTWTGGDPVHLLGSCLGGFVARTAVLDAPRAVRSLTLISSGPGLTSSKSPEFPDHVRELLANGGPRALWEEVSGWLLTHGREGGRAFDSFRRNVLDADPEHLLGFPASLRNLDPREADLSAVDVPKLVVHGGDDDTWPPDSIDRMARRIGARSAAVAGAGHGPLVERPAATTAMIRAFLESSRPALPEPPADPSPTPSGRTRTAG